MKKEFLDFLCCPCCNNEFDLIIDEKFKERIKLGKLVCKSKKCNQIYNIENFVPRFVISPKYADSFGEQWNKFAKTQLDNKLLNESELRWNSEIGWEHGDLKNKKLIEFGSGAGRFIDLVSRRGANLAVGIDVTSAVDAAQESFKDRNNVFFIQADIFNPPIKKNYFDFGYSIGVLHHTPNPEKAFAILASLLTNEAQIGVSLYEIALFDRPNRNSLKQSTVELLWAINLWRVEFFRLFTIKLPNKVMINYCIYFVPLLHYINKIPIIRYLRYFFPSTCYRSLPVDWSMCDTYDTYATKIGHMYRHKDIFLWFMKLNIQKIIVHNSIPGWVSLTGFISSKDPINYQKYIINSPKLRN
mgnify:CR=1 FL=1